MLRICVRFAVASVLFAACGDPSAPPINGSGTITVETGTTLQQIVGWEATAQAGQFEIESFPAFQDEVLERTVNELGVNRVRLEVRSGAENDQDYFALWRSGAISRDAFRDQWYAPKNDNSDPNSTNLGSFHFAELDAAVDEIVTPLRQRVLANGEQLYINLCFVDFHESPGFTATDADEYAEFMLVMFQHLQSRYGWVPDAVEIILEPDNSTWSGAQIGRAIVATDSRLAAAGFNPDFIAPSTTNMSTAVLFFDDLDEIPGATAALTELSYHRYAGVSQTALQDIAARAASNGLGTSMLEHIGSGYEDLHADLKIGMNTAWSQFTIAWDDQVDDGGKYYLVDVGNGASPEVRMGQQTKLLRQYMFYIRSGAQRVGAGSTDAGLDPLAFINPDGKLVVVVKASGASDITLGGIPIGTYGVNYSTLSDDNVELPEAVVTVDGPLAARIPGTGVITFYQK